MPGIGLTLVPIPAGTFTMGSPPTEAGRADDEEPRTRVTLSRPFWMGRTEVTHGQWRTVMGTDLVEQARLTLTDDKVHDIAGKQQTHREFLGRARDAAPETLVDNDDDDAPMYWVSWEDAVAFCRRLNARERAAGRLPAGHEYRLPTEAEWEYACRAGTTTATYAGDMVIVGQTAAVLDKIAWYGGNLGFTAKGVQTAEDALRLGKRLPGGKDVPRTVATKEPNAWGLYDMIGNVWEWCHDWYAGKYPGGHVTDPTGPPSGSHRVIRGGRWGGTAQYKPLGHPRSLHARAPQPAPRVPHRPRSRPPGHEVSASRPPFNPGANLTAGGGARPFHFWNWATPPAAMDSRKAARSSNLHV